jgi:adenylate cyclase
MWQLLVKGPHFLGRTVPLPEGTTTLGRAEDNDLVLPDGSVSRYHARLRLSAGQLQLEDLGSRNGSKVNGRSLEGVCPVKSGDTLSVGEYELLVRQLTAVENAFADEVDLAAGGLLRLDQQLDLRHARITSRPAGESRLLESLEETLRTPADLELAQSQLPPEHRSLVLLLEMAEAVSSAAELQAFLDEMMRWARQQLALWSATVLLRHRSGVLVPVSTQGEQQEAQVSISDGIVAAATLERRTVAVSFLPSGHRQEPRPEGKHHILCAPVGEGLSQGVLYLHRRKPMEEAELPEAMEVCTALASLAALGVSRFRRVSQAAQAGRLRKQLVRHHAPDILRARVEQLTRAGASQLTGLEEHRTVALVVDLHGFGERCSRLPPAAVAGLLEEFYEHTMDAILSCEGMVDKFVGDSVLALFGVPEPQPDAATLALRCALVLRESWKSAMKRRPADEQCLLQSGIASGKALVGVVGSSLRQDYTAFGEPVRLASWLASMANPEQVLATGEVLASSPVRFDVLALRERMVPRLKRKVALFDVLKEESVEATVATLMTRAVRRPRP